jgi:ubiquitin C-terminal hydrolase
MEPETSGVVLPSFLYDLVGTVNHFGTLQSGHYVANVMNDTKWYHCNDAHVSFAGQNGDGSTEVASGGGAYILFYVRR